jgi:hypothetical protein
MVMQCPAEYHLCQPNQQRSEAFCDLDFDCDGDQEMCRGFTVACPAQTGCCVVSPFLAVVPDPPPLAPPRPPAPLVPVCPQYMHLCAANEQQDVVFCDVDQDCWGDQKCGQSPAGRCIQHPTIQPKPDGWVAPLFNKARLSTEVCDNLFLNSLHLFRRMWGAFPRTQNRKDDDACWSRDRWAQWTPQPAEKYFEDILYGRYCKATDWCVRAPLPLGTRLSCRCLLSTPGTRLVEALTHLAGHPSSGTKTTIKHTAGSRGVPQPSWASIPISIPFATTTATRQV